MALSDLWASTPTIEEGLEKMKEYPNAVLLDVRSESEYLDGHLENSMNVPLNTLPKLALPKETPIFVYCLSGGRANRAAAFLKKTGYDAVNIGGIANYKGKLV